MLEGGTLNSLEFEVPISLVSLGSLRTKLIPKRDVPLGWEFCDVLQCISLHEYFLEVGS